MLLSVVVRCSLVFGRGVKYRYVLRVGPTRQQCVRFRSTAARHGQYAQPTKGFLPFLTMTASLREVHTLRANGGSARRPPSL